MNNNKQKIILGFISGALAGVLFITAAFWHPKATLQTTPASSQATATQALAKSRYDDVALLAKAAFVYKPSTGEVLFTKNADAQLPLASITKIMSAIVAHDELGDDTMIAFAGNMWKIGELLNYTLMVSSNEAAQAIAATANTFTQHSQSDFVDAMNTKAHELNLNQTYFLDVSGLDVSDTQSGGYGSARDVANLFAYALSEIPAALESTALADQHFYIGKGEDGDYPAINTNKAIGAIPGLIAGKTGFTDLAGGNLVVAFDAGLNEPIVAVVLGSTKDGRFTDIEELVRATMSF